MGIIRLLLALSVVVAHCGTMWKFDFVGGQVAVQSFYIISGFYMTMVLSEKYVKENNSYKLFITNRMLRIFPIYWAVVLLSIITSVVLFKVSNGRIPTALTSFVTTNLTTWTFLSLILSNLFILGQDVVMFLGIDLNSGKFFFTSDFTQTPVRVHGFLFVQQAWTLALELMFYLLAPFILKRGWKVVALVLLSSLALRMFLFNYYQLTNDAWTYRFFPTELMFFLLGYFSYFIYLKINDFRYSRIIGSVVQFSIIAISAIYFFIPQVTISYSPFLLNEFIYFAVITFSIPFLFVVSNKNKIDNQIGELSYPVYISHLLVYQICMNLPFTQIKSGLSIALLTILVSIGLNKLIVDPMEKIRQARLSKTGEGASLEDFEIAKHIR